MSTGISLQSNCNTCTDCFLYNIQRLEQDNGQIKGVTECVCTGTHLCCCWWWKPTKCLQFFYCEFEKATTTQFWTQQNGGIEKTYLNVVKRYQNDNNCFLQQKKRQQPTKEENIIRQIRWDWQTEKKAKCSSAEARQHLKRERANRCLNTARKDNSSSNTPNDSLTTKMATKWQGEGRGEGTEAFLQSASVKAKKAS